MIYTYNIYTNHSFVHLQVAYLTCAGDFQPGCLFGRDLEAVVPEQSIFNLLQVQ